MIWMRLNPLNSKSHTVFWTRWDSFSLSSCTLSSHVQFTGSVSKTGLPIRSVRSPSLSLCPSPPIAVAFWSSINVPTRGLSSQRLSSKCFYHPIPDSLAFTARNTAVTYAWRTKMVLSLSMSERQCQIRTEFYGISSSFIDDALVLFLVCMIYEDDGSVRLSQFYCQRDACCFLGRRISGGCGNIRKEKTLLCSRDKMRPKK